MTAASISTSCSSTIFPPKRARSDGRTRLGPSLYYARLTQRLISALTAPTKAGRLYEVDMRLQAPPSQGPLATQFASFKLYQQDGGGDLGAHGVNPRARFVGGDASLGADLAKTNPTNGDPRA